MLLKMLADNNVQVLTSSQVVQVEADGVLVKKNGQDEVLPVESLVLATGMTPRNELQEALTGKVPGLYAIGDCVEPRHIINAIWEAFSTARTIE
jgi:thioredoxin reductase